MSINLDVDHLFGIQTGGAEHQCVAAAALGRNMASVPVRLLRLRGMPILEQLRLEEALLRATNQNWMVLNDGTPGPTVVMGISG